MNDSRVHVQEPGSLSIYVVEIGLNGFLVRASNKHQALQVARSRDHFPDGSWRAEEPVITRIDQDGLPSVCHWWCNEP